MCQATPRPVSTKSQPAPPSDRALLPHRQPCIARLRLRMPSDRRQGGGPAAHRTGARALCATKPAGRAHGWGHPRSSSVDRVCPHATPQKRAEHSPGKALSGPRPAPRALSVPAGVRALRQIAGWTGLAPAVSVHNLPDDGAPRLPRALPKVRQVRVRRRARVLPAAPRRGEWPAFHPLSAPARPRAPDRQAVVGLVPRGQDARPSAPDPGTSGGSDG